nr:PTS IIA-like nitrogen regulatory protein PtsN [Gammaproteobacteria bacterium]
MRISDILTSDRVRCGVEANSKKRALEVLSAQIALGDPSLTPRAVFDCLLARERLGSTGLGSGIAIPHGRLPNLPQAIGAFIRLKEAVNFDALDNEPVDLLFGLLVPAESTDEHLQLLSLLAEGFSDEALRQQLRAPEASSETVFLLLTRDLSLTVDHAVEPDGQRAG